MYPHSSSTTSVAGKGSGGSAITVQDEGTPLSTAATTLNFVGAGVTATGTGAVKTITIPGSGSATITVKENGTSVSAAVNTLDFLGADFDVTESPAGEANIVISAAIARAANVQPLDTDLTAIAALISAADKLLYSTGAGTWALADLSAAARTVLDDTTVAAMVNTLGGAASTGTGGLVRATSPTFVTPDLGTPSVINLSNATAVPAAQISGVIPIGNLATGTPTGSKFIRDDGTLQDIPGGGDMLLASTQTVTGVKTFGSPGAVGRLVIAGNTSGSATLNASAAAGDLTFTLPSEGPTTLVGRSTTDTLTNKTLTSPVLGGTITGTYTLGGTPTFPSSVVTLTGSQTLTNKTLTAPTISALNAAGITTYDGATVVTVNAMGALAIDTSKPNTKSISADSTFTFSAQPATDTWFSLYVTNTDTAPHILTIPSCFSFATQAARTTFPIAASGQLYLVFRHRGSGAYTVIGDSAFFNKFDATAAPGVGDDVADGYGPGSLWMDVTGNALYVCETNGAGAAVWTLIGGGSGDMVLASVQTVTGEKTFGSAGAVGKLKVAGNTSGSTTIAAAAVAGATTFTLPAVSGTAATLAGTETLTAKQVHLAAVPGTDDAYEGQAITGRNAGATIAQWEAVYLGSGGTWLLADADGSSTQPARGLAVAAYTSGNAAVVLDNGVARNDAWAWTVGGDIYLSTTAGGLTQTAPVTGFVQKMGYALSADTMRVAIGSSEILGL